MSGAREWLGIYLRGLCMGTADAVPGVSGGTIALITGIYERLIAAITSATPDRIRRLLTGLTPSKFADAHRAFRELDGYFLLVLGAGIVTAIVTVLRAMSVLLETNPVETFGFFFGLIAASAIVLYRGVELDTPPRIAAAVAGFAIAFALSGYTTGGSGSSLPVVFVAGAIAVSAMILPGLSGSLLLVILGQYEYMSNALSNFVDALIGVVSGNDVGTVVDTGIPVFVFVAGAGVGLLTIAHVVKRALETHRMATIAFLVSLIVGALRAPVVEVSRRLAETGGAWTTDVVIAFAGFAVLGAAAVLALDYYAGAIEY
ncbi:DUF368 domain-containing protein [Haloferacaceae archaeon DSL9]